MTPEYSVHSVMHLIVGMLRLASALATTEASEVAARVWGCPVWVLEEG